MLTCAPRKSTPMFWARGLPGLAARWGEGQRFVADVNYPLPFVFVILLADSISFAMGTMVAGEQLTHRSAVMRSNGALNEKCSRHRLSHHG